MASALLAKSWGDLKKRKSRTIFTILTIALGVAALGMFAVVPIMDMTMVNEVEDSNLYDVSATMMETNLTDQNKLELAELENVEDVESRFMFFTRIFIGERRNDALIIGVDDFNDQSIDIIDKTKGEFPTHLELMADSENHRSGLIGASTGDTVKIYDSTGQLMEMGVSGVGHTLRYDHPNWGVAVFYTTVDTARMLANGSGYNLLLMDLDSNSDKDIETTIAATEGYLVGNTNFVAFTEMPMYRTDGDWPGKDNFNDVAQFFYVLTFMTMFCALFLIANTMHTIVTEQRKEIAQMKAVGATKLQVIQSYLMTSIIMGTAGSATGAGLGIGIAFGMVYFLCTSFFGVVPSFLVYPPVILLSIVIGVATTVMATGPALFLGLRVPVREGMESAGISSNYGANPIDKALLKAKWMPSTMRMGFRNVSRKKGRSISTFLQVALAVAMFLGVVTIGHSLTVAVEAEYGYFTYDIMTMGAPEGGRPLVEDTQFIIENIDGVDNVEPFIFTTAYIGSDEIYAMAFPANTIAYDLDAVMIKGREFNQQEEDSNSKVVLLSKTISRLHDKGVGDMVDIEIATGTYTFEVIGVEKGQMMNGMHFIIPLSTMQELMQWGDMVSGFNIVTSSSNHGDIDAASTAIEDVLLSHGYVVSNEIMYVMEEQNTANNQQTINMMIAVGTLIVLITMIGLMSTLTMNIIERTKEIGMMRCIGSSSWAVRAVFGTEGITMGMLGWIVGIPLGFAVGNFINWQIYDLLHVEMDFLYPPQFILISMIVTLVVTVIVIQPPLWRATHFKPGEALRYQ